MTGPEITGTQARASVSWFLDVQVERGSVPDRPVPYNRAGNAYRPDLLRLTFGTSADSTTLAQLNLRHVRMTGNARRAARVTGIVIYGPRLRANGQPGAHVVTENFYGNTREAPEWAQEIAAAALAQLTGDPS